MTVTGVGAHPEASIAHRHLWKPTMLVELSLPRAVSAAGTGESGLAPGEPSQVRCLVPPGDARGRQTWTCTTWAAARPCSHLQCVAHPMGHSHKRQVGGLPLKEYLKDLITVQSEDIRTLYFGGSCAHLSLKADGCSGRAQAMAAFPAFPPVLPSEASPKWFMAPCECLGWN